MTSTLREPGRAATAGEMLHSGLCEIQGEHPDICGAVMGKGLVAGLHIVQPGGIEPDAHLAADIVTRCTEKGLLMFHPVGFGGATVKIAPPLVTPKEAIADGVSVLREAIEEARQ